MVRIVCIGTINFIDWIHDHAYRKCYITNCMDNIFKAIQICWIYDILYITQTNNTNYHETHAVIHSTILDHLHL